MPDETRPPLPDTMTLDPATIANAVLRRLVAAIQEEKAMEQTLPSRSPPGTQSVVSQKLREGYHLILEAMLAHDGDLRAVDRVQLNQALGYVRKSITRIESRLPPTWEERETL